MLNQQRILKKSKKECPVRGEENPEFLEINSAGVDLSIVIFKN